MNPQLLVQLICVEEHYEEQMAGKNLVQIVVTRQQSKKWTSDLPQPLNKVVRYESRPIKRNPRAIALFMDSLAEVRRDWDMRQKTGLWPAMGIARRDCGYCWYEPYCRGELPMGHLRPLRPREVDIYNQQREARKAKKRNRTIADLKPKGAQSWRKK